MEEKATFTHLGWIGLAPIMMYDTYSNDPVVMARITKLEWWLDINIGFYNVINRLCSYVNPDFEPYMHIRITEECEINVVFDK